MKRNPRKTKQKNIDIQDNVTVKGINKKIEQSRGKKKLE
jgi:hypothetical protein